MTIIQAKTANMKRQARVVVHNMQYVKYNDYTIIYYTWLLHVESYLTTTVPLYLSVLCNTLYIIIYCSYRNAYSLRKWFCSFINFFFVLFLLTPISTELNSTCLTMTCALRCSRLNSNRVHRILFDHRVCVVSLEMKWYVVKSFCRFIRHKKSVTQIFERCGSFTMSVWLK